MLLDRVVLYSIETIHITFYFTICNDISLYFISFYCSLFFHWISMIMYQINNIISFYLAKWTEHPPLPAAGSQAEVGLTEEKSCPKGLDLVVGLS